MLSVTTAPTPATSSGESPTTLTERSLALKAAIFSDVHGSAVWSCLGYVGADFEHDQLIERLRRPGPLQLPDIAGQTLLPVGVR